MPRIGLVAPILAGLLAAQAHAQAHAQEGALPVGSWKTEDGGGIIRVQPCGQVLCGVIVGLSDWPAGGGIKRDWLGRPQCHSILLAGLKLQDDGRWHGTVTNPENGRAYSAEVWVPADGRLRLRGYVGVPLFGSTQIWPPFKATVQADCHFGLP